MQNPPKINFNRYLKERYGPFSISSFRKLEELYKKLSHTENSLTFMCRCRDNRLIPKFLRIRLPFRSNGSEKIKNRFGYALVRERINFLRYNKRLGVKALKGL
ncbi:uncharacterized protein LOC123312537 [Coccinella septempunctata]|uniref:uncharacterized protein LOC123312537 n=1 Tax=Coccinella septempunctata TaxID=41139 RepID=UPI001D073261|nr:uncharacterized protein LOC123312537 [Coccinella septempunctata]